LIEGVFFGLFVLCDLADQEFGLFFPQTDVVVVSNEFDLDVGLFLYSEQVLDVGLVEEGDVRAFFACPACPA
jgi:hypothetical protein